MLVLQEVINQAVIVQIINLTNRIGYAGEVGDIIDQGLPGLCSDALGIAFEGYGGVHPRNIPQRNETMAVTIMLESFPLLVSAFWPRSGRE